MEVLIRTMKTGTIKRYSEMIRLPTFEDRYKYLKLTGAVGESTFGFDRYVNQMFYGARAWKKVRNEVILRDNACDLGIEDRQIAVGLIVHHINPITLEQIENEDPFILDPDNLVCVSASTHNAIHFGDERLLARLPKERRPNDTCPWK